MAVNLVGEPAAAQPQPLPQPAPLPQPSPLPQPPSLPPHTATPAAPPAAWAAPLQGLEDVDATTAARLVEIHAAKAAAIAAEDYDEAKRLKAADEVLRSIGTQIKELEAAKAAAVAAEDYDACKALKVQVDGLRNGGAYKAAFALQPVPEAAPPAPVRQATNTHMPPASPVVHTGPTAMETPCSPGKCMTTYCVVNTLLW